MAMAGLRGFCLGDEQEDFRGEAAREQMVPAKGSSSAEFAAKLKIRGKLTACGAGGDKPDERGWEAAGAVVTPPGHLWGSGVGKAWNILRVK